MTKQITDMKDEELINHSNFLLSRIVELNLFIYGTVDELQHAKDELMKVNYEIELRNIKDKEGGKE